MHCLALGPLPAALTLTQAPRVSAPSQPLLGSQDDSATTERKLEEGHGRLSPCPTRVLGRGFLHKIAQYSNKSSPVFA